MADVESGLVPKRPNDEGEAICHVRWMVETPGGWLGAWDRQAFDAYVSAAVAAERDRCAKLCDTVSAKMASTCPGAVNGWWPDQVGHQCMLAIRGANE